MIVTNPNLRRLDKQPITELDLVDGRQLRSGREKGLVPATADDPALFTPPISMIGTGDTDEEDEGELSDLPDEGTDEGEDSEDRPPVQVPSGEKNLKGVDIKKRSLD